LLRDLIEHDNPQVTLPDFLESLFSRLAQWAGTAEGGNPHNAAKLALLDRTPLFVLGDWDDISASIMDLRKDLVEDLADGLMAPFPSIAVAYESKSGWLLDWIHRTDAGEYVNTAFHEAQDAAWFQNSMEFEFHGKQDGQFLVHLAPQSVNRYAAVDGRPAMKVAHDMGWMIEDSLFRVALISHPENYVVKKTPKLTPREQRKVDRGEPIPIRKRPYYVVLDHTGLVNLRQESISRALKLPLPHARRGHWMRLAERCAAARSAGKDKVWRRETYVGDTVFETASSRFEVFMSARDAARADGNSS